MNHSKQIVDKVNKVIVENLSIIYQESGVENQELLLLHGWGQSHAFWKDVNDRLSSKYHIYTLDLPGFGLSQEPPDRWNLQDYADFVHKFVTFLNVSNPIIIGHSFGGRIATVYASKYPVKKLVLYSNGGLPQEPLRKKIYKHIFVNIGKYIFPNFLYRTHTAIFKPKYYQNKIIVNKKRSRCMLDIYTRPSQNLKYILEKITTKTLIISGKKDYIIQPTMGRRLHKAIRKSHLVEIENATHFAHLERPEIFYKEVENFLNERL